MSQKSILSFFKAVDPNKSKENKSQRVPVVDSPIKNETKKRKVKCIESDEESSDIPNKKLNGDCSKTSETPDNKARKSGLKSEKNGNDHTKNGDISPRKSPQQKKIKSEEGEINSSQPSEKIETENSNTKEEIAKGANKSPGADKELSNLNENGCSDFIPKRKTARKQFPSAKKAKQNDVNVVKEEPSKTVVDEVLEGTTPEHKEAEEEENKEAEEEKNKESEVDVASNTSSKKDDTVEKHNKSEKSQESAAKVVVKVTDSKQKKSSPKTRSVKEECTKKNTKRESAESKKCTKKESAASKKITKRESAESKKCAKTESVQNFFTPLKKVETPSSTEEKDESMEIENDDSPVKKASKKKTRCLESDDENEECASSDVLVKKEVEDIEMTNDTESPEKSKVAKSSEKSKVAKSPEKSKVAKSPEKSKVAKSPEKSKVAESSEKSKVAESSEKSKVAESPEKSKVTEKSTTIKSETSTSEVKNSPSKESKSENSKTDPEKQKLSIKSTSATDTIYDPSKSNYHPIEDAFWKKGEKVPYLALAKTLELIENTSGRLKTIEILSNYFRSVIVLSPDDFLHSVYLCLNRVAPEYEGIEMGVGDTLLMKAVAQATGRTLEKIKAEVAVKGDLGLVSESSRGNQRVMFAPPKLTVSAVFNKFLEIAKMTGNSAMAKKTDKIKSLFVACRDCEAKYIIRSLSGKLRIGLAEQSILSAIARAAVITPPGQPYPPEKIDKSKGKSPDKFKEFLNAQTLILKTAYCECPNYDLIIPVLLKEGISVLPERCQLSPGVPLKPMLAHPTAGIDIVLERFDKNAFTCEFKYDGERAQIHMNDKGEVRIFSRNQEDNTSKYPDIISRLPNALKESTKSFILDSEAVAWDKETKQILPFQVLSTRKRKDAKESEIVVQVCVMAFDLLYLNGEPLVKKPLKERRELLHSSFNEVESQFMFAQYRDGDNAETMQEFLDESVKGNCEGLMVKALEVDATYEIAKRSHNWLKLKKDYLQGIGDTLDLVVIGGYFGKGKRTGSYGGFLLACYDNENEEFQSICKLGTGFKDDTLETHTTFLKQHVIKEPKSYYRYDSSLQPDEWFDTVQVWEIKCADLSISPVHKAAIGIADPKKGISLRFPRFIRIRDDKSPEDATNSAQIADMYQKQQQIQNTSNKNSNIEEDYY